MVNGKYVMKEHGLPGIGGVIFAKFFPKVLGFSESVPSSVLASWLPRVTQITPVELLAPVVALLTFGEYIKKSRVLLLVDNEAVESALVKGYSNRCSDLCQLIGVFWELVQRFELLMYIDRVPTDSNPSDGPSRGKVGQMEDRRWMRVPGIFP